MRLELAWISGAFFASCLATLAVRRYALRAGRLDVPNERSMHVRPTPRGGGLAIVAVFLTSLLWLAARDGVPPRLALALAPSGAVVAAMGWIDDRRPLPNSLRLIVWAGAAIWAIYWVGGLPRLGLGPMTVELGWLGWVFALVGVVWLLNLYNFMDGTDGLAGTQAVMVSAVAGSLIWATNQPLALLVWLLGASSLGFLAWNLPPARIFMGDVASGFLGFAIAVLALYTENEDVLPIGIWGILMAVFLVDATFTVLRRLRNRENLGQAHRSHAYQVQARRHSHAIVLTGLVLLNLGLTAVAVVSWLRPSLLAYNVVAVILVLTVAWRRFVRDGAKRSP